ncbi:SDR family NAD(P)-dependent oxidoreductase [Candidatus Uabimicrobium sp. HlEnr_7]|uniref:SDR family NAD(P)-dependent oxidoreductase n=1 Tax=Candidatus Uabimicrobium helgolandensis TaxID=3095367 RepID=UPI00355714C7
MNFVKESKNLVALFEEQVQKYPQKIAVQDAKLNLTYTQVNSLANSIAHELCKTSGSFVATYLDHCVYSLVAVIAIFKSGKACVVLNPSDKEQKHRKILHSTNIKIILTQSKYNNYFLEKNIDFIDVELANTNCSEVLKVKIKEADCCYITYTSGSTGNAKGVVDSHANILYHIKKYGDTMKITGQDRGTVFSHFSYASGITNSLVFLLNGASVHLFDIANRSLEELNGWLEQQQITILHCVPTVFLHFTQSLTTNKIFNKIRLVRLGGEGVHFHHFTAYKKHFTPQSQFIISYSATETPGMAFFFAKEESSFHNYQQPLGFPLRGVSIQIVDENRQPVAPGVEGEIAVVNKSMSMGYWQNSKLTDKCFVVKGNQRIYYTGDHGYFDKDGCLYSIGRKDSIVKILGQKVSTTYVANAIRLYPKVKDCVVIAKKQQLKTYLVAYVVFEGTMQAIRDYLSDKIPIVMIPNFFVKLVEIPLASNGKINRRALPEVKNSPQDTTKPLGKLEEIIADIWQKVLVIENVMREDDFFLLGGNSLLALRIISQIKEILGLDISVRSIFEAPTLKGFAGYINEHHTRLSPIIAANKTIYPLSCSQQRLWFLHCLEPQSLFYNTSFVIDICGNLDIHCFEKAVASLIKRQSALRIYLDKDISGNIYQKIKDKTIPLVFVEINAENKAQLAQEMNKTLKTPFILTEFPLVRIKLIRIAQEKFIFCLAMHHIISDHWSKIVLWQELAKLYNSYKHQKPHGLLPLKIQYGDFCLWQRQQDMQPQKEYWSRQFSTCPPPLQLTTDYRRPKYQNHCGASYKVTVTTQITSQLKSLALEQNTTLFMLLFAAYSILLHRYSNQQHIVIGIPISNRSQLQTENLIGFFVNILPVRIQVSSMSWIEFLQEVKQKCLEAYAHQDYPFEKLVEEVNPMRDMSRHPIFQTMFNLVENHNTTNNEEQFCDLVTTRLPQNEDTTKFDISLYVHLQEKMHFRFDYSTDLFSKATIERMTKHFIQLLKTIIVNPRQKVRRLKMLEENELISPNIFKNLQYKQENINTLLQKVVSKVPKKIALSSKNKQYTYSQLDVLSSNVCSALQNIGVESESLVVILNDYSVDTIVAMYGILRSGGTCIPLNPDFLTEKAQKVIEQAQVILCNKKIRQQFNHKQTIAIQDCINYQETKMQKRQIQNTQAAFIIYTSGSTGAANGVVITHRNIASKVQTTAASLCITSKDVCILTASFSFIAALRQIFTPLIQGAKLLVVETSTMGDPLVLFDEIAKHKVSVVDLVPSYCKTCAQVLLSSTSKYNFRNIRQIATSGEKLSLDTVKTWRELIPRVRFLNIYGQTETTAGVTLYEVPPQIDGYPQSIPVGRAVGASKIYVLDVYLQPVPQGVVGDIYIESPEIARNYYMDPINTALKFVPNPFNRGNLYKAGDRGRYNSEQQLEIVSRADAVVKIRGYRVDTLEIETALRKHPQVCDAAVIFLDDMLKAYLVSDTNLEHENILEHLQPLLPEYMIPQKTFTISKLPTTNSGKIDYLALEELDKDQRFLYIPKWKVSEKLAPLNNNSTYLLFADNNTVLKKPSIIIVREATDFSINKNNISIDFDSHDHYQKLISYLEKEQFDFKNIIYGHQSFEFFAKFVKAFETYLPTMQIAILCRNVFPANDRKNLVPENALIVGASRVLPHEYPGVRYACIDLQDKAFCENILRELQHNLPETNVTYIDNQRYICVYQHLPANEISIKDDQVYLITGGSGNIGSHLALSLAKKAKVKIAITTRSKNNISEQTQQTFDKIKQLGAQVAIFETSLSEPEQVQETIEKIERQLGDIHGVMHCAGTRQRFNLLNSKNIIEDISIFKTESSQLLIDIFQTRTPSFVFLFSSLSSILGRYCQAGYAATNAYLDTVSCKYSTNNLCVTSINWDVWRELPTPIANNITQDIVELICRDAKNGISNEQGIKAIFTLPQLNHPQVIVSKRPDITGYYIKELMTNSQFVAPSSLLEKQLATIWCEVLQLKSVSVNDNFFNIGGHSLLAITLMEKIRNLERVRNKSHQDLPLSVLLTHPTIAQLTKAIISVDFSLQQQVIPMNTEVSGNPIFMVHAAKADPICYNYLAKYFEGKRTVYTIRTDELSSETSIEQTAYYHYSKIKSVQANGPYIIGGMCMGGLVAYELARQIKQNGEQVQLVFIMDSINIPGMKNYKSRQQHEAKKRTPKKRIQKSIVFLKRLISLDTVFVIRKLKKMQHSMSLKRKIKKLIDPNRVLRKKMRNQMRIIRDKYDPQNYEGEIIYIRSEKEKGNDAEKRFRELAQKVKCYKLTGTIHSDVSRPHFAQKTSQIVQKYLDKR